MSYYWKHYIILCYGIKYDSISCFDLFKVPFYSVPTWFYHPIGGTGPIHSDGGGSAKTLSNPMFGFFSCDDLGWKLAHGLLDFYMISHWQAAKKALKKIAPPALEIPNWCCQPCGYQTSTSFLRRTENDGGNHGMENCTRRQLLINFKHQRSSQRSLPRQCQKNVQRCCYIINRIEV